MKVFLAIRAEVNEPVVILGVFDNPIKARLCAEEDKAVVGSKLYQHFCQWGVEEWEVQ